jgi:tetratricopeptide (TPR) repeat protein
MERKYQRQLIREADATPQLVVRRRKYWKPELFEAYLRLCDERLFEDPQEALARAELAPEYAALVIRECPEVSAPVLRLRAHATLGSVRRGVGDFEGADAAFEQALQEKQNAPPLVRADLYRRLAYLRLFQRRPEAHLWIGKALTIHRLEGYLVDRHEFGCCLLCRGHIQFELGDAGEALVDISAALNHISLRRDEKPYYAALHNLSVWAVDYGTEAQLFNALEKLKPALHLLAGYKKRHFPKYKLRWLVALVQARLGQTGQAELTYLEVRKGLLKLRLPFEAAMLSIDLGLLYLRSGRLNDCRRLAGETIKAFQRMASEPNALAALMLWRRSTAEQLSVELLRQVRKALAEDAPLTR